MRNQFVESLVKLEETDGNTFLIVADLGYSVIETYAERFPDKFINVGVAEQNMMGIAAGIASEGFKVFCYSIGNFSTFRCAEQIRNDIDYHDLAVCIVSVGGGVAYGNMGYSHHAIQDYGLMRLFPNTMICSPGDPEEVKAVMSYIYMRGKPSYLRLHKQGELNITEEKMIEGGRPLFRGGNPASKTGVITSGYTLQGCHKELKKAKWCSLWSIPVWGMEGRRELVKWGQNFESIIVVEDHVLDGGLASWILECFVGSRSRPTIYSKNLPKNLIGVVAGEESLHTKAELYDLKDYERVLGIT